MCLDKTRLSSSHRHCRRRLICSNEFKTPSKWTEIWAGQKGIFSYELPASLIYGKTKNSQRIPVVFVRPKIFTHQTRTASRRICKHVYYETIKIRKTVTTATKQMRQEHADNVTCTPSATNCQLFVKPRPHWQQCRSNIVACYKVACRSNIVEATL